MRCRVEHSKRSSMSTRVPMLFSIFSSLNFSNETKLCQFPLWKEIELLVSSCMRRVSDFVVNSLPQLGLKTRIQDVTILFFIKKNGEIQDNYYLLVLNSVDCYIWPHFALEFVYSPFKLIALLSWFNIAYALYIMWWWSGVVFMWRYRTDVSRSPLSSFSCCSLNWLIESTLRLIFSFASDFL